MFITIVSEIINIAQLISIIPISTDKTVSTDFKSPESFESEKMFAIKIVPNKPKRQINSSHKIGKKNKQHTITP